MSSVLEKEDVDFLSECVRAFGKGFDAECVNVLTVGDGCGWTCMGNCDGCRGPN